MRLRRVATGTPYRYPKWSRYSSAVLRPYRRAWSGTTPSRGRTASRRSGTRSPSSSIRPASGCRIPPRHRSVVDLPAPFWPSSTRISPRSTSRSTPRTAATSPKLLWRPWTRITGGVLASAALEQRLEVVADLELNLVARSGGVEANKPVRVLCREADVFPRHLAVKVQRLLLHAVLALACGRVPAEPCLHIAHEQERLVRARKGRRPGGDKPAPPALVGERRVVVAIGDHDLPGPQRRCDDLGDRLPAGSHEEVHLGLGVDGESLVKEDLADVLAELRSPRLADHHRLRRGAAPPHHSGPRRLV